MRKNKDSTEKQKAELINKIISVKLGVPIDPPEESLTILQKEDRDRLERAVMPSRQNNGFVEVVESLKKRLERKSFEELSLILEEEERKVSLGASQSDKDHTTIIKNNNKTGFPLDTRWEDMTWTLLSNEMFRIEAKGTSKKFTYFHLGFTDGRRGDTPNTRWAILQAFAQNNGEIRHKDNINKKEKGVTSAAMRDIRKKLNDFFNINDNPFHAYRKTHSYKTKFTINDNRHIDNTDDSESKVFSEEEIKEYLNNPQ